jgi:hypothetical protein
MGMKGGRQILNRLPERVIQLLQVIHLRRRHRHDVVRALEEIADVHRQRVGQPRERRHARIGLDALDFTEVFRGQPRALREPLLREPARLAQMTEASAEVTQHLAIARVPLLPCPLAIGDALGHAPDYRERFPQGHPLWVLAAPHVYTYG